MLGLNSNLSDKINEINDMTDYLLKRHVRAEDLEELRNKSLPGVSELKGLVTRYERELQEMGPVNQMAIETYEHIRERYEKIKNNLETVLKEKEKLQEMEETASAKKKEVFMKTYEEIRKAFREEFRDIFGGGDADLRLENPDDPFSGGLEIYGHPPNSKPMPLMSMSGGEKGLTSLALIFAIQKVEPSPFYIFDEPDHNLDAINSNLLAEKIWKASRNVQFIVVSHHQVTLKKAERIYGVSRSGKIPESRIVSISKKDLDLEEFSPDADMASGNSEGVMVNERT